MDQRELDRALDELEARLDELHLRYQGFFTGREQDEPLMLRLDVDRALAALMSRTAGDSASRGKLQRVLRTYDQYQQSWERLARRVMNGQQRSRSTPPEAAESSEAAPPSAAALSAVKPVAVGNGARRPSLTPPLGTPLVPPVHPSLSAETKPAAVRPVANGAQQKTDSNSRFATTPVKARAALLASRGSESARGANELRSPSERHSSTLNEPRRRMPLKLTATLQGIRIPQENELTPVYSARERSLAAATHFDTNPSAAVAPLREVSSLPSCETPSTEPPVSRTLLSRSGERLLEQRISLERVKEVHERLRQLAPKNAPAVSLERLATALRETEEKLRAQHGDRRVTFDVILKEGRPVVKPIVH